MQKRINNHFHLIVLIGGTILLLTCVILVFFLIKTTRESSAHIARLTEEQTTLAQELKQMQEDDQFVRNEHLQQEITAIEDTYGKATESYEALLSLEEQTKKDDKLHEMYAGIIALLSERNYASATAQITELNKVITEKRSQLASAASAAIPDNVPTNNAPPGAGYQRQYVQSDVGTFLVDVIAADLGSTRVIVDTASDSTCVTDCPVDALGNYATRSGAFAGINGPYFCPASYPGCAGKTNSFDTLLMNKNKVYFNSDNNVYSTVPAVIFSGSSARFVGQSQEWGRDTGVDSVIASQPMLLSGSSVIFGGDEEIKRASKGARSFIGTKGSTVYIGVVHTANVAEVARVLKTMGLEYALNLDSGGSTALWSGGRYIVGPGRNTPFGILFVHK